MNVDIMKELLAIAGRLDEKGFTKEADVIDRITKAAAPGDPVLGNRPSLGGGGAVETLAGPIIPEGSPIAGSRDRFFANRDAPEGTIKPVGDPYTYNYDEENDLFIVATDPNPPYRMVGYKMREGSAGYKVLKDFLPEHVKANTALWEKMTGPELTPPQFDGHAYMQYAYEESLKDIPPENKAGQQALLDRQLGEVKDWLVANRTGITESGLRQAITSAGLSSEFNDTIANSFRTFITEESPNQARTAPPAAEQAKVLHF